MQGQKSDNERTDLRQKSSERQKGLGTKGYGTEDAKRDYIKRKLQILQVKNVGVEVQVFCLRL